jgi:hypothetical protein
MVREGIIVGASSAGSCADVLLWVCYVQAGFMDCLQWRSSSRTRASWVTRRATVGVSQPRISCLHDQNISFSYSHLEQVLGS